MHAEKLASLERYAQNLRDRLATGNFPKRDNSAFLKLDLEKTVRKIEKAKLEGAAPAAQAAKKA
jgi:hypothetical protein